MCHTAGLMLALFGGTRRGHDKDTLPIRSDSHVLVVGDPGTRRPCIFPLSPSSLTPVPWVPPTGRLGQVAAPAGREQRRAPWRLRVRVLLVIVWPDGHPVQGKGFGRLRTRGRCAHPRYASGFFYEASPRARPLPDR